MRAGQPPVLRDAAFRSQQNTSVQKNPFTISISTTTPGHWLYLVSIDGSEITLPATEVTNWTGEFAVDTRSLSPGVYKANVTITPTGGAVLTVPVTVTVSTPNTPVPVVRAVVNAASSLAGGLAPGEIVSIYGANLGPATPLGLALDFSGKVSTSLGGTAVLIGGKLVPLVYVSSIQINCVVPYDVGASPTIPVQVILFDLASERVEFAAASTTPAVFTGDGSGKGRAAILGTAMPGSTITLYLTGEGQTNPPGVTGAVTAVVSASGLPLTPQPVAAPVVTIGGLPAVLTFYGEAPGLVSGVLQINAIVPAGALHGDQTVVVSIGGAASQPGVIIPVQ